MRLRTGFCWRISGLTICRAKGTVSRLGITAMVEWSLSRNKMNLPIVKMIMIRKMTKGKTTHKLNRQMTDFKKNLYVLIVFWIKYKTEKLYDIKIDIAVKLI
jgi:hypothetical protein